MLLVLFSDTGVRDGEATSAAVLMGSPLVCSIVVAIPRRKAMGARRRVASRRAMVDVLLSGNGKKRRVKSGVGES